MMIGIYNSAKLVAVNKNLRNSIHKHVLESRLLGSIGKAEWENEIQNIASKINREKANLAAEIKQPLEFDEKELKEYTVLDFHLLVSFCLSANNFLHILPFLLFLF